MKNIQTTDVSSLQLSPISLNTDYRKRWNIRENDFIGLSKNGELINKLDSPSFFLKYLLFILKGCPTMVGIQKATYSWDSDNRIRFPYG